MALRRLNPSGPGSLVYHYCTRALSLDVSRQTATPAPLAPSNDPNTVAAARSHKEIPGPRSLIGRGVSVMLGLKTTDRYEIFDLYKQYGDIVRVKVVPGMHILHLFDPVDMEFVYRSEGRYPIRLKLDTQYAKEKNLPFGILNADGQYWEKLRKPMNRQLMRPRSISAYLPAQQPIADDMVKRVRQIRDENGEIADFMPELTHYAMEAVSVVFFAKRLLAVNVTGSPPKQTTEFIHAIEMVVAALQGLLFNIPLHKIFPTPTYKMYRENADIMCRTLMMYIDDTVRRSEERDASSGMDVKDSVALRILRSGISSHEAMAIMFDVMFAGLDTTSSFLGFCLYHLAKNQAVQERLYQDIIKEVKKDNPVSEVAIDKMSYLKAVVKETLRLTPIAPTIPRILEKDIMIKGYRIPAGELMFLEHGVAGRLGRFEDADNFVPERWLRAKHVQMTHPFTVMPFGFGRRMCIGRRLAEQQIRLLLIRMLQNFHLEYHHEPIGVATRLVSVPDKPLRLTFIDRN